MSVFTAEISDQIVETCRENAAAIAESLNMYFGTNVGVSVDERLSGTGAAEERVGDGAGVVVTFRFGDEGAACLIPESLPLPDWYKAPSEGQANQLQTLGMEWSAGFFPLDLEATEFGTATTQSLKQQIQLLAPAQDASVLELQLKAADAEESTAKMLLVWPLTNPVLASAAPWPAPESPEPAEAAPEPAGSAATGASPTQAVPVTRPSGDSRNGRVLHVPVDLVVQIAAKKVDVGQVRNITPGTLITFDKTCEALLDVFVANKLKFRGEAVKVGERFGIKINEANAKIVREQHVHRV
ncbi:MAG: FliM/FliN family flagellar motor switch protein [Planctomycetota bacterium]|jgi:flagellar motor switch protein FliN/FliY